ncbi:hypothetical protein GCM10027161_67440 [Microbispora hainanensis]
MEEARSLCPFRGRGPGRAKPFCPVLFKTDGSTYGHGFDKIADEQSRFDRGVRAPWGHMVRAARMIFRRSRTRLLPSG